MKEKLEDSQHATNRLELETLTLISDRLCPTGHRTVLLAPLLVGKANIISRWYYTFISELINCLHAEGSWSGRELYLVCGGVHTNPVDIVLQERAEQLANEAKAKAYALSMAEKLTPPNLILTRAIMEHPRHHQQTKQNKNKHNNNPQIRRSQSSSLPFNYHRSISEGSWVRRIHHPRPATWIVCEADNLKQVVYGRL